MEFQYINTLKGHGIEPNFWISQEYFEKAGFVESRSNKTITIRDIDDQCVFPPLSVDFDSFKSTRECWADFPGYGSYSNWENRTFLDYNYIYNPASFRTMKGRKWGVFRKNTRKFPRRYENSDSLVYHDKVDMRLFDHEIAIFANNWSRDLPWDEIEDGSTLINYLYAGEHREFLYDTKLHKILAMNIWDENWIYVNYRYCLCLGDNPFLSEYMRLMFYTHIKRDKYVNDGGVLGNEHLKKFKDKLNPIKVNKIYSWEPI